MIGELYSGSPEPAENQILVFFGIQSTEILVFATINKKSGLMNILLTLLAAVGAQAVINVHIVPHTHDDVIYLSKCTFSHLCRWAG